MLTNRSEKTCRVCDVTRPVTDFYPSKQSRDGLKHSCKSCNSEYNRARYAMAATDSVWTLIEINRLSGDADGTLYAFGEELDQFDNEGYLTIRVNTTSGVTRPIRSHVVMAHLFFDDTIKALEEAGHKVHIDHQEPGNKSNDLSNLVVMTPRAHRRKSVAAGEYQPANAHVPSYHAIAQHFTLNRAYGRQPTLYSTARAFFCSPATVRRALLKEGIAFRQTV